MLVSAAEPILQVTSNPILAFVFCNLIVLVIFLGTKFDSTDSATRDASPVFSVHHDLKLAEIEYVERFSSDQIVRLSRPEKHGEEKLALGKVTEVCGGKIEIKREDENEDNIIESKDENENKNENEEEEDGEEVNDDEDDNGNDELRRRIEDFIAKVNREWEAENLKERMHELTLLDSGDCQMYKIDRNQSNFKF